MNKIFYKFTTIDDGNLAYHVLDKKENVDLNRLNLSKKYDFDIDKLISMNQVHGNNVICVDKNSPQVIDNCDGIITNVKDLTLMVMVADCIPIIFIDEIKGVIAAVHAGRESTFLKISEITVKKMINEYKSKVDNIKVIMGPSIQKCCYEVDERLANLVKKNFGKKFVKDKCIDLQGINKALLENLSIKNIYISSTCTKCSKKAYFSYRLDKKCGRFAGIISLNKI